MSSIRGTTNNNAPTLAVIGGGLAGIAAAEAANRNGFRVTLFERSKVLGGRVASMFEPVSGNWIDNGQHLVMGCCTETLALHERLGLERFFQRCDSIPFSQTGGKRWTLAASRFFPRSWQLLPAFLGNPFFTVSERLQLGLLVRKLVAKKVFSENGKGGFSRWLKDEKAPKPTIEKFWAPLVLSALGETLDNVGCEAVRKVVRDGFLAGRDAMAVWIPTVSLRSIYHDAAEARLRESGVEVKTFARIKKFNWILSKTDSEEEIPEITSLESANGDSLSFDAYILAVPTFRVWEILHASDLESYAEQLGLDRFEPGAITTLHLWFDRRIFPDSQRHTALLGGPGQFLFCPRKTEKSDSKLGGFYHTVIISAAHRLLEDGELTARGSDSLVDRVLEQLRSTFPKIFAAPSPKLLHRRVTTYFDAVFSPGESLFMNRPMQATPFSNLALAGDWTQTFWPATMEGAVRSGLRAVEALEGGDE